MPDSPAEPGRLLKHFAVFGDVQGHLRPMFQLCRQCQPCYNFYAHHKEPAPPATLGRTQCYWQADVSPKPGRRGRPSCMGILRWSNAEQHAYKIV